MHKINEAKKLVKEISGLQHELFKEGRLNGLLRSYQIAVEVAEKAAKKAPGILDYKELSERIFGSN